ncbi:hypothetical protein GCM10028812_33820 [Ancylobacter sonchi]
MRDASKVGENRRREQLETNAHERGAGSDGMAPRLIRIAFCPRQYMLGRVGRVLEQMACEISATNEEPAELFGVNIHIIARWKSVHDEFCQALKAGKGALISNQPNRSR